MKSYAFVLVGALAATGLLINAWYKPLSSVQTRGVSRADGAPAEPLQFEVADLLRHALTRDGRAWTKAQYQEAVEAITEVSQRYHYAPAFICGLIHTESRFDLQAVSSAGALGLTQLLPPTAEFTARCEGAAAPSREELFKPGLNIRLGFAFLSSLEVMFGSREAALAAYNGGPEILELAAGQDLPLPGYRSAVHTGEREYLRWLKTPGPLGKEMIPSH